MVERESNIELLRIIAMFMIILHHICVHCVYPQLNDVNSFWQFDNGFYREAIFYKELMFLEVPASFGKSANAIFILISGYFLIERGKKNNLSKNILNIVGQAIFVTIILTIVSFLYFRLNSDEYVTLIGVNQFNEEWWFIGYYIFIIVVGRLFLNEKLNLLTKEKYKMFLLILFSCCSLSWLGSALAGVIGNGRTAICGIFLYSLGGYIKKFDPFKNVKNLLMVFIIVASYLLLFLSNYNMNYNSIQPNIIIGNRQDVLPCLTYYEDYNLIPMVVGIVLFELFLRLKMTYNKYLNIFAKSLFMTYLLHDNPFVHRIWRETDWVSMLHDNITMFILYGFIWAIGILTLGFMAYKVYGVVTRIIGVFIQD